MMSSSALSFKNGISLMSTAGMQTIASPYTDILTIFDLQNTPHYHVLRQDVIAIGRAIDNDIVLDDSAISRFHARLSKASDHWLINDLNSTNGVYVPEGRVLPKSKIAWQPDRPIEMGPFRMVWHRHHSAELEKEHPTIIAADKLQMQGDSRSSINQTDSLLTFVMEQNSFVVAPNGQATLKISLVNHSAETQEVRLRLLRIPNSWMSLPTHWLEVEPEEEKEVVIPIHLPQQGVQEGSYPFQIDLLFHDDQHLPMTKHGRIAVKLVNQFEIDVSKEKEGAGQLYHVNIHNKGQMTQQYELNQLSADDRIQLMARKRQVELGPDEKERLHLYVETIQRPWFGQKETIPFEFIVSDNQQQTQTFQDVIEITPRISRLHLAILVGVLLGVAFAVILASLLFG